MSERIAAAIVRVTGNPFALLVVLLVQPVWIAVGVLTHLDPFPFVFLLTVSNVVQIVVMFAVAVAQNVNNEQHHAQHGITRSHLVEVHAHLLRTIRDLPGRDTIQGQQAAAVPFAREGQHG